jgi:hypothetical protein
MHDPKPVNTVSLDPARELARRVESYCQEYTSTKHPGDSDVSYSPLQLSGFLVWRVEGHRHPYLQVTVVFPKGAIFAEVRYAQHGRQWTRQVLREYCAAPDLSQELLSPLTDVNFKPPEN